MQTWKNLILRIRKFPTAVCAFVLCAVFALLLIPEQFVFNPVICMAWLLGVLMLLQIWTHFKEDNTCKISGIVPAWIMLIAGFVLLFTCSCRELSLGLILLSVCAYSAGIIFALKMIVPFSLLLGMCGYTDFFNAFLLRCQKFFCGEPMTWVLSKINLEEIPQTPESFGGPALTWALLLIAFLLVWKMQKTPLDQFYHYILIFPILALTVDLHFLIFAFYGNTCWKGFAVSFSFGMILFILGGLPLLQSNRKKQVERT